MEIKVGDKVKLRSGGPVMIATLVVGDPSPWPWPRPAVECQGSCRTCSRRPSLTRRASIGSSRSAARL